MYDRQGKFLEAQEIFRKIALSATPDARAYLGLAKLHWANANYTSAKQVIDHAFQIDPLDPEIFWSRLQTLKKADQTAALRAQAALLANPTASQVQRINRIIQALADQEKAPPSSCKITTTATSTEVKLEALLRGPKILGGYAVPVRINDSKATLQVDTGAGGILISARVAKKAGLQKISDYAVGGFVDEGPSRGYRAIADKFAIGDLEFSHCYVQVVDHLRLEDEDGLLGTNIFEDFLVDLDFPQKTMRLSLLPPVPDVPVLPPALRSRMYVDVEPHNRFIPDAYSNFERVYRVGRDLLVPTRVNDATPRLFMLDTGGFDNMISPALAHEASKLYAEGRVKVKGLSGEVKDVYRADDVLLTFGRFQQHRRDLISVDLQHFSEDAGTEISGILGFAMLWVLDIKIDYRDHLIDFQVDPNKPH